jgi:hypothetical protein
MKSVTVSILKTILFYEGLEYSRACMYHPLQR